MNNKTIEFSWKIIIQNYFTWASSVTRFISKRDIEQSKNPIKVHIAFTLTSIQQTNKKLNHETKLVLDIDFTLESSPLISIFQDIFNVMWLIISAPLKQESDVSSSAYRSRDISDRIHIIPESHLNNDLHSACWSENSGSAASVDGEHVALDFMAQLCLQVTQLLFEHGQRWHDNGFRTQGAARFHVVIEPEGQSLQMSHLVLRRC